MPVYRLLGSAFVAAMACTISLAKLLSMNAIVHVAVTIHKCVEEDGDYPFTVHFQVTYLRIMHRF